MTSQEVVQRSPEQHLLAQIRSDAFKDQIQVALPSGMRPERFVRVAATALLENPSIAQAEPQSVLRSLLRSAADGLLPDGREAALVMFKNQATYLPMISGYRKIAADYGWALETRIVHANDEFAYELGLEPRLRHVPVRPGDDPGDIIAAYAIATNHDGRKVGPEVMSVADIEKVRGVSRSKDKGPWVDWWARMAEKTVGRALFKKLPLSDKDQRVARLITADLSDGEAALEMYGRSAELPPSLPTAAVGMGEDVPASSDDAGEAGKGAAAGDDPEPLEGSGSSAPAEPEPDTGEQFPIPDDAAIVADDMKATGEQAGQDEITVGKHHGKTLAQVVAEDRGEGWLLWLLQQPEHPQYQSARTFAAVFHPDLLEAAGETKGEAETWRVT